MKKYNIKKHIPYTTRRIVTILLLALISCTESIYTQSYYFYVQFSDKNNSPYSLSNPSAYLSPKALERRAFFGLVCDSTDLPVNNSYVNQISNLGVKIHSRSKWLNGITLTTRDSSKMSQVRNLPFVKKVQFTGIQTLPTNIKSNIKKGTESFNYGMTSAQINQIKGNYLHNLGYSGKGITIGVLDAGFSNVNINTAFDSLRLQNRLLGTKDIIEPTSDIFAQDTHGANVLSIMAGNKPGDFLGSAPHASFWLIRTEYTPSEYLVETDFWVAGIEFADSVGVDIVNSSLGYTTFDNPSMNFTYADMNGKVSRASMAAKIAAKKGIIVCNSMGNDGIKTWKYLGSPADAEDILAVGAVTSAGIPSAFTSFGPASDNRVKPDVTATGTATAFVNIIGTSQGGNGTSYSCPIIAGTMACYLQYIKKNVSGKSIKDILESVRKSGANYTNPTDMLGYGIPDFQKASSIITSIENNNLKSDKKYSIAQNNFSQKLYITNTDKNNYANNYIQINNNVGQLIFSKKITAHTTEISTSDFKAGIYIIQLVSANYTESFKIILSGKH